MRAVNRTGDAVRSTRATTRRELLLETLALRHQLGVLARSNGRFRPADRLSWLFWRCFGLVGGVRWCSPSHPLSLVGFAQAYVAARAAARDIRVEHASIDSVAI